MKINKRLVSALKSSGLDTPTIVLDLDILDQNIEQVLCLADPALTLRLVAKSLPSRELLEYSMKRLKTKQLMTFSEKMLNDLLAVEIGEEHLIGKPLPVSSAERILRENGNYSEKVVWLCDTPMRLRDYSQLALSLGLKLKIALEIDVGLHRGGFSPEDIDTSLLPFFQEGGLILAGLMGYEAHLAKLPSFLKNRAEGQVRALLQKAIGHCSSNLKSAPSLINSGGSLTFHKYRSTGLVNDISLGSILVKPRDFAIQETAGFSPAAFLATPVLKSLPRNPVPGLEFLSRVGVRQSAIAIHSGNFPTVPVHPVGAKFSKVFGRSSNQEIWTLKRGAPMPRPGDIAVMWPCQSEAVLNLFDQIVLTRGGELCGEWSTLRG